MSVTRLRAAMCVRRVCVVKLVAVSKLIVTREQSDRLLATMKRVNAARTWLASEAATSMTAKDRSKPVEVHHAFYRTLRERFGINAQMAVRAIADVAACFRGDAEKLHTFRDTASITYDARILTFRGDGTPREVSIATLDGRVALPIVAGGPHHDRLAGKRGETDLMLRKGRWYLSTSVEVMAEATREVSEYLGVDLGIVNIATDSDGERYSGDAIERVRVRHQRLRDALQARGTRSAKRHLRRLVGQEARFRSDTNHVISKRLVASAKGTDRGLALEDLRGIRGRVTVRQGQRARHGAWAFHQLRAFVAYKAERSGVPVVIVDPRNTSRTCPACACCDKRNRPSQSEFRCIACGFGGNADHVASRNIAFRATVNRPIVSNRSVGNGQTDTRRCSDASLAL